MLLFCREAIRFFLAMKCRSRSPKYLPNLIMLNFVCRYRIPLKIRLPSTIDPAPQRSAEQLMFAFYSLFSCPNFFKIISCAGCSYASILFGVLLLHGSGTSYFSEYILSNRNDANASCRRCSQHSTSAQKTFRYHQISWPAVKSTHYFNSLIGFLMP